MNPILSIIMPCYFKAEQLNWGLASLARQIITFPYEILILNDGLPDETESICNKYRDKLNIKYLFTGQRNLTGLKWQGLPTSVNKGVKLSEGKHLILTCPEIFYIDADTIMSLIIPLFDNSNLLTIPLGKDDAKGEFLGYLSTLKSIEEVDYSWFDKIPNQLNTKLPFCMGMTKEVYNSVDGFEEEFAEGYAHDDNDFIDKLMFKNYKYFFTKTRIIHIHNSRKSEDRKKIGVINKSVLYAKNLKLYKQRHEIRLKSNENFDKEG